MYTESALYRSKNECARTENAFSPISQVCDGTVSLIIMLRNQFEKIKIGLNIFLFQFLFHLIPITVP